MALVNLLDKQAARDFFCGWARVYSKELVMAFSYSNGCSHKLTVSAITMSPGNGDTLESQPDLRRTPVLCVDRAPFPLGIYYLLKTNLLVSGSSGFLRASCNISSGLQSQ